MLPSDTVAVLSIPDGGDLRTGLTNSSMWKLWWSPELQPFRDRLMRPGLVGATPSELTTSNSSPEPATVLALGQVTLAVTRNGWLPGNRTSPAVLVIAEGTGDGEGVERLLSWFTHLSGRHGAEVSRVLVGTNEFGRAWIPNALLPEWWSGGRDRAVKEAAPSPETGSSGTTNVAGFELITGRVGNLLLAATDLRVLEGVLERLAGGSSEQGPSTFREFASRTADNPRMQIYGWLDFGPIHELLRAWAAAGEVGADQADQAIPMPTRAQFIEALGLPALREGSFGLRLDPAGTHFEARLRVPAEHRTGLVKMLELDLGDASPPPYVPASVIRWERARLDFRKAWVALERAVTRLFPQAAGVLSMLFETASPAEGSDLKADLLASLGQDLVTFELAPRTNTIAALTAPPSIYFLGSTNPVRLLETLKAMTVFLPPPLTLAYHTNPAGRRIYSVYDPRQGTDPSTVGHGHVVSVAAQADGVLVSTDEVLLREMLSTNSAGVPLRGLPELAQAAVHVGGMTNGLFGYLNLREGMRWVVETMRHETNAMSRLLALTPLAAPGREAADRLDQRLNLALLPPYDQISSHFHFLVYSAAADSQGFVLRLFAPRPPEPPVPAPREPPPPPPTPPGLDPATGEQPK
jgi:hypothetical protein